MFAFAKTKLGAALSIAAVLVGLGLGYQNCGRATFSTDVDGIDQAGKSNCTAPQCQDIVNGNAACDFNGQSVPHGTTINAFLSSNVSHGNSCQSQARVCTNGQLTGSYLFSTCTVGTPQSCLFNGQTIASGSTVQAFLTSTVATGGTCQSETRTCANGTLSGTYAYASCTPGTPQSCLFNGQTITAGSGVIAYLNSSVPSGSVCQAQFRLCTDGQLSGTYSYGSCSVSTPQACLFNGQTVPSGMTVVAYQNSSVGSGQTCVSETRLCSNGTLSGSYSYSSCAPQAASCLFAGQTIPSGSSVVAYQNSTVAYGQNCQLEARACNNGVLSGSYAYASCSAGAPAACLFNGQSIASGQSVLAYQNSTVPNGQSCAVESRTCSNGTLSGSYAHASCSPGAPATCNFNGQSIASGQFVLAYQNSSVPYGQNCVYETRLCSNGSLSGSYAYGSCSPGTAASCTFNGQTVAHGQTVTSYQASTVPYGQVCVSESRTCSNGALSGSYTAPTCTPGAPASCTFNGQAVAHGADVIAYQTSSVPFGSVCTQQTRTCQNGTLSGTYTWGSCTVSTPASCQFDGQTIAHGQSVTGYQANEVPFGSSCSPQTRTCNNGTLSGTYAHSSCVVKPPSSCTFNGQSIASGSSVTAYLSTQVPYGETCQSQTRTCNNGTLSGVFQHSTCQVTAPASCTFDGQTVASGTQVDAYEIAAPVFPAECKSEKRTCTNGSLSGSFTNRTCTPTANAGWINSNVGESYYQTCRRVGLYPVVMTQPVVLDSDGRGGTTTTDPNGQYGLCASGESRPNGGYGFDKINYRYGIWNRHTWNPHPGGTVTYGQACYKIGQKQDGDGTDIAVAFYCIRTDMGYPAPNTTTPDGGMGGGWYDGSPGDNGGGGGF